MIVYTPELQGAQTDLIVFCDLSVIYHHGEWGHWMPETLNLRPEHC